MNSDGPSSNSSRPPIPTRLHDKPTAQGLTIPYLTLCHRGRLAPVWGAIDPHRYALVLTLRLCQVCGEELGDGEGPGNRVIVFVRPQDWLRGVGPEPGVHPECAAYSTRACPMLAGRMPTYRSTAVAARITPCQDAACECRHWAAPGPDSEEAVRAGKPADAWYSVLIDARDYRIVHMDGERSSDSGYGVALRNLPMVRLRRVQGAPMSEPTILDAMAAAMQITRLTRDQ